VKWVQLPVYLLAQFSAGAVAAVTYGLVSRTRADRARRDAAPDATTGTPVAA
jgi:glycerol uptake facilitator protein